MRKAWRSGRKFEPWLALGRPEAVRSARVSLSCARGGAPHSPEEARWVPIRVRRLTIYSEEAMSPPASAGGDVQNIGGELYVK